MFPKSFVSGQGQELLDKNPIHDETAIFRRVSSLVAARVHNKKDGLIKYVPASGIDPATGTWQILDIDTQPLTQFASNLPFTRIDGNLPASRSDNIDMSKVAIGQLDQSRINNLQTPITISFTELYMRMKM